MLDFFSSDRWRRKPTCVTQTIFLHSLWPLNYKCNGILLCHTLFLIYFFLLSELLSTLIFGIHVNSASHAFRQYHNDSINNTDYLNLSGTPHSAIYESESRFTGQSEKDRPYVRRRRQIEAHSPPHILPDLPSLLRFFDRTGLQVLCRAAGNPPPQIRWFSLPTTSSKISQFERTPLITTTSTHHSGIQMDDNYASELGFSSHVREAPQADASSAIPKAGTNGFGNGIAGNSGDSKSNLYQIVVGGGWLNFTATRSSTMRMVFFCQAENYLGQARSRKMIVHQVPMPDENLRIIYTTFPIQPKQKAVITCQPEQGIFNRFLRVKYWEVYLNGSLISTVDHSFGRFSMINVTKHPELHIRSITDDELDGMEVRCVLQSIVDELVRVERPERGRLQRLQFRFSYTELRSVGTEISVLRGSTVELPWAVEGELRTGVDWYYINDASHVRQAIALDSTSNSNSAASSSPISSSISLSSSTSDSTRRGIELPWGTKYELVDGAYGNLRLINLSVADSGHYIAESSYSSRSLRIKYTIRVRAPLGVKITPNRRTVDWGSRVELTCEVTGHPRQLVYWLHNARLVPRRHHVRQITTANNPGYFGMSGPANSMAERLIIEAFTLEDIGVYQCIAENGHSADRLGLGVNGHHQPSDSVLSYRSNTIPPIMLVTSTHSYLDAGPDLLTEKASTLSATELNNAATTMAGGEDAGDLIDNAQATALLMMGKMRPSLIWQNPAVELGSSIAQVLLSVYSGATDALLECRFAANPTPRIIWYRDDQPIPLDETGVLSPQVMPDDGAACTTITRLTINLRKIPKVEDLWTFGGEYRASAENTYGQADCRTFVLIETELRLRPFVMGRPAIAGRAYTLKCYFIGSGIPTLQWHRIKNGQEVRRIPVDHRHQLLENARVLRIMEVNQEEDEADYRCTATLGDMTANMTVSLKVSHAPRLFDLPQTRQVKDGRDMLSYSCALQNRADKPWYAWWEFQREGTNAIVPLPPFKNKNTYDGFSVSYVGDVVSQSEANSWRLPESLRDKVPKFVHTEPNSAVHVTVNELRKEQHHGNLSCIVINEVGSDRQSIRVTFIPELEFEIRPPNNQDVILGQTISIDCTAKPSDLQPIVEWKYLQKTTGSYVSVSELAEATNGRIGQLTNGTLSLSNVDDSDPREFLCFLKPGRLSTAAQRSSAVNLEVHVPARIDPIEAVEKVRGSRFNLTCSVHGDPDDLKAAWYYRLSSKSPWRLIDRPCVVPLALVDRARAALRADGTLDPAKLNDVNFIEGRNLILNSNPLSRSDSTFSPTSNSIGQGFGDGDNVDTGTTVDLVPSLADCRSYATEGLESGILFSQVSFFKPNKRGLDRQLQFTNVREVHMGEYLCRASNKYNRNNQGQPVDVESFVRLTVISVPDPVQFVYNSSHTTATSVSFAWLPPLRDGNKPIRQYRIRYSHSEANAIIGVTDSSSSTSVPQQPNITEIDVDENQNHIELNNLRPYTKYHITVAAINDVGPSVDNALALTTQEAKPDGPVRRLIANGTASDTILISWDNPAPEHLNGNVDRYLVCRQRINDNLSKQQLLELPWPDEKTEEHSLIRGRVRCTKVIRQRDHEITGLPKFTAYAFRVIAMNSKGASPPAYTQARTLEDLPQAPPADVACASQQHSITVSWNPPNSDTINGILTEYHVSYFAANVYGDETSSVNQAVKGQTTVTLAGLLAYTNYTIQVSVNNRKGRGPASPRIVCLTKEAPPGPPERVKAKPINSTCLVVSWIHPRKPQGLTKNYCLEAVPLMENSHDGLISLFPYPASHADRTKSTSCVKPDFTIPYNYYFYCGLIEQRPYNISVRGINQFEGHKAWTGPVSPIENPPIGIISFGGKIITQNKMRILMDCLVIGGFQPHWIYPHDYIDGLSVLDNGTLLIESAHITHSGQYECSAVSDTISYDLLVQEILEEPPRKPIWYKFTPSLRGIQAEWLSRGSKRLDAPILWFYLNWTNLLTGLSEIVRLDSNQRTYYLSNLTCATTVKFQLRAENKVGNSSLTEATSWTTLGSAPLIASASQLIPHNLRFQDSVTFNLSSFLPGSGCPPSTYRLLIAPSEDGHFMLKRTLINKTLTRKDLITLEGPNRERCCYNITKLNSGSYYHYKVIATNAAGSSNIQGQFWTRTVSGHEPTIKRTYEVGKLNLFQQPTIIVPITVLFAILIIVVIILLFFCRHRRLEADLRSSNKQTHVTRCRNDLRPREAPLQQQQLLLPHSYHSYQIGGQNVINNATKNHRKRLKGTMSQLPDKVDSQASTVVMTGRKDSGIKSWFSGARTHLYDRGRQSAAAPVGNTKQPANLIEEDRLSTNSVDSEGNINPYATYAATGFQEQTNNAGVKGTTVGSTVLGNTTGILDARNTRTGPTRDVNFLHVKSHKYGTESGWNTGFKRGLSIPSEHDSLLTVPGGHHYHYPNLDNAFANSTLGHPRIIRVGSSGRLKITTANLDPRLLPPGAAALIDPALAPYNNGTLECDPALDLDEEFARVSVLDSLRGGLRRRVNSFDSLHRFPREHSQTYHRGFGACNPSVGRSMISTGLTGSHLPPNVSFYEPGSSMQPSDPSVAYRGSVLSSTTVSSNHEELMQAYEYGRKHQLRSCMTLETNSHAVFQSQQSHHMLPVNYGAHILPGRMDGISVDPTDSLLSSSTLIRPVNLVGMQHHEGETSGGSASSDATDSGIRQFTQQPPQSDNPQARLKTCELPIIYDVKQVGGHRSVTGISSARRGPSGHFFAIGPRSRPDNRLLRCELECPSELTDTYCSVDYNGTSYGQANRRQVTGGLQNIQRPITYGALISRSHQPLPALPPSSSTLVYPNGDPGAVYNESGQSYQTYYYPSARVDTSQDLRSDTLDTGQINRAMVPQLSQIRRRGPSATSANINTTTSTNPTDSRLMSCYKIVQNLGSVQAKQPSQSNELGCNSKSRPTLSTAPQTNSHHYSDACTSNQLPASITLPTTSSDGTLTNANHQSEQIEENVYTSEFVLV